MTVTREIKMAGTHGRDTLYIESVEQHTCSQTQTHIYTYSHTDTHRYTHRWLHTNTRSRVIMGD